MLSTPEVVASVASQIRLASEPGSLHIDCSTISPAVSGHMMALASAEGKGFVHAPVLGSATQVTEGALVFFAGGRPEDVARARPMLETIGKKVYEFADVSRATNMKLLANFFIAGMVGTLAQGILFARAAGIEIATLLQVLSQSALNAPMYQTKGPAMEAGDYTPRFYLEHMRKDVHLAADSATAMGVTMPSIPLLAKLLDDGMAMGLGKKDYSAVLEVLVAQSLKR
jgi:3-hydroxyisobutyrate dehydrogenase-like beta-hydroxyacid dehydrogenase